MKPKRDKAGPVIAALRPPRPDEVIQPPVPVKKKRRRVAHQTVSAGELQTFLASLAPADADGDEVTDPTTPPASSATLPR